MYFTILPIIHMLEAGIEASANESLTFTNLLLEIIVLYR